MAGPSPQNMQDQMNQAQQNAWAQAIAQQQPMHPMIGGAYPPPPSMAPQMIAPQGAVTTTSVPLAMGKLSLLAIALSLMLLGAFTFLGGFLLGMWFESPRPSPYVSRVGEVPALGLLPPQQQTPVAPQMAEAPAQGGGSIVQGIRQGAQDIGFGNIASNQAGYVTQSAVTRTHIPGVPSFLTPLITATQYAVGQQLGYKAQQQVGHDLSGVISPPSQPSASSHSEMGKEIQRMPMTPHQNVGTSEPLSHKAPGESTPGTSSSVPLSQGEKGEYTVQLGVYASKENAMSLVNHLQGLNYTSHVTEGKSKDGGTLYYVHSGDYKEYSMALEAASQCVAQNIPGAIVVKITQKGKGTT